MLHEDATTRLGEVDRPGGGIGPDHRRPGGRHRPRRAGGVRRGRRPPGPDQRRGPAHLDGRRGRGRAAARAMTGFGFTVGTRLPGRLGRTGMITTPHGVINDTGVRRGRHQGHGQGGAAGEHGRARRAGRAGQRLPPVPAAGPGHRRGGRRTRRVHELAGPDLHRQRRIPGDEPGRRVQEGAGHEHRRAGRRRRDRRGQDPAGPGRRRRGHLHLPPGRLDAPLHPRDLDADPAPARRRRDLRLRRVHHADEHPRPTRNARWRGPRRGRSAASPSTAGSPPSTTTGRTRRCSG